MTIRTRLILLVLACVVPLSGFGAALGYRSIQTQRDVLRGQVVDQLHTLSLSVDRYIAETQASLEILATSPALQRGDLRSFHAQIKEALRKRGIGIVLLDPSGQQLVSTNRPFGAPLPRRGELETLNRVVETGRPQISDLVTAAVLKRPILSVEVPVFVAEGLTYVLAMGLTPETLSEVVRMQQVPPDWLVGVLDRNGVLVARSRDPARFVGQPAAPDLLRRIQGASEGRWFESVDLDGQAVFGSFVRSPVTGWTTAIAVPREAVSAPIQAHVALLGAAAAGTLLLGLTLAVLAARGIAQPLNRIARLASGLDHAPLDQRSGIVEIDHVSRLLALRERQRDEALAHLTESERRLRATHDQAPVGIAETDLQGRYMRVNGRMTALTGYGEAELLSLTFADITHPDWRAEDQRLYRRVLDGEIETYAIEKKYVRKDGSERWVEVTCSLVRDDDGRPKHGIRIVRDITELKLTFEKMNLLIHELNHRVKNTLATVQAIALQTARNTDGIDAFSAAFQGRLIALSKAHDLLTATQWTSVSARSIAEAVADPFNTDRQTRVRIEGAGLALKPDTGVALAMALHELATNAAKHGSLSVPDGWVVVSLSVVGCGGRDRARVEWKEHGGPPVAPPGRRGFGSRLVEQGLAHQLQAETTLAFEPDGVRWTAVFDPGGQP